MLFPTHLVAAVLVSRVSGVSDLSPLWLVVGAALPDVVDKPLAVAGLVELFHSVGHSLFVLVLAAAFTRRSVAGVAVSAGWALHLFLDAFHVVLNGRAADAFFLFRPLVTPPDPLGLPPLAFVRYYIGSPAFFVELFLWVALAAVLVRTGCRATDRRAPGQ